MQVMRTSHRPRIQCQGFVMARRVLDATLDSRTARSRLKSSGKPYWRQMEPGVSLGYRKPLTGSGKWVLRFHLGGKNDYVTDTFANADDSSDADGLAVLDFWQAQEKARERMVSRAQSATGVASGPKTVGDALDSYIDFLKTERKSADEAEYSIDAFIRPTLGKTKLNSLTTEQIRKWLKDVAASPARVRTKPGQEQKFKPANPDPKEQVRQRKNTANRILTQLKGALNRAFEDGHVASDRAWRRVKPFKNVDAARIRFLSKEEVPQFMNGIEDECFRKLVRGALESGARYSELYSFLVQDFNADAGTLSIYDDKNDKSRFIILSDPATDFFLEITAGRDRTERIFLRNDDSLWSDSLQKRPMASAIEKSGIAPITFHGLRHTWASHAVMNGMPLLVVAKNLGHTTTKMVEKHYGHLAPSFVVKAVRDHAPTFGLASEGKVRKLRPSATNRK